MGFLKGADPGQAVLKKSRCRHDQHRRIDEAGQAHGNDHVHQLVTEQAAQLDRILDHDPTLGKRRVKIYCVRHDRGADNPRCQQYAFRAGELRHDGVIQHAAPVRPVEHGFHQVADRDDADQYRNDRLDRAEAVALQPQDQKSNDGGDESGQQQGDAEQQIEPDRRAEEFGQIGGHCHELHEHPHQEHQRARKVVAALFGQILP